MKISPVQDVVPAANPHHIDVRKVYDSPHATAVVITLRPGESLKKHITPVDVVFYTIEGETVVEIGDERETVSSGCVVESPARIPHLLANESGGVCRVLVVKVPGQVGGGRLL